MFQNKSVEFRAAAKTVGVLAVMIVCGSLAAGFLEVFGLTALLSALMLFIVYQLITMMYNSYLYDLKLQDRQQTKND